jgi:hypothetical protein
MILLLTSKQFKTSFAPALKHQDPASLTVPILGKFLDMDHPSQQPKTTSALTSVAVVLSALMVLAASVLFAAFLSESAPVWDEGWDDGWAFASLGERRSI